jgi:Ca2+-binding EF-hand superfamily protein
MAFMISKETENVQSSEEIENAFRAITNGERPYVTKEELYAVMTLLNATIVNEIGLILYFFSFL